MTLRGPAARAVLPWLHAAVAAAREAGSLPAMPALRWIAGRGNATRAPDVDWREWLLAGVDAATAAELRRWPAGPSVAAAAGVGVDAAPGWALAQPVHLLAGMDHVRMAPLADAVPSRAEAEQLAATLREHFTGDAFELLDFIDGAWLVRCDEPVDCRTHDPATLVGCNIHDYLPAGADAARMRSRMNEIQMLLHEHPVNVRRAGTRAAPINGLWLWGFGQVPSLPQPVAAAARWVLRSDDLWLRAFWRVHGGDERAPGAAAEPRPGATLWALAQPPTTEPAEALAEVDSSLLARLARDAQSGTLHGLDLHDGARVHRLDRHSRLRFWRRPAPTDRL